MRGKLKGREFLVSLQNARNGEEDAFVKLLDMYMPMFAALCYHNGQFDEDLYQELAFHLFLKLPCFPLDKICCQLLCGDKQEERFANATAMRTAGHIAER